MIVTAAILEPEVFELLGCYEFDLDCFGGLRVTDGTTKESTGCHSKNL